MRVLVAFGTRPEAIKLAPVVRELRSRPGAEVTVCLTGQHRQMVEQVVSFFGLEIDRDLGIMSPNQTLADVTVRVLGGLDRVLAELGPDWIVVQGDTTTTFAAALAGYYHRIRVAHVEAGLRSFDKLAPYPEEVNRILTTHLADLHLAPTGRARENLLREGVSAGNVHVVGNTVVDALLWGLKRIESFGLGSKIEESLPRLDSSKRLLLVTGHRRESFGEPFEQICWALRDLAEGEGVEIVYPVHLNPNVRKPVFDILGGVPGIHLVDPVEYPVLLWLMRRCHFIVTDSGGIQEEAPSLGKPVVVMRQVTERQESVEAGVSVLAGNTRAGIVGAARRLLREPEHYRAMARKLDLYGDGDTSRRIADLLGLPSPTGRARGGA